MTAQEAGQNAKITPGILHRVGVFFTGVRDGAISVVTVPLYAVDALNWAVKKATGRGYQGSLHDGTQNVVTKAFKAVGLHADSVDKTDKVLHFTGEITGAVATGYGILSKLGWLGKLTTAFNHVAPAALQGKSALGVVGTLAKTAGMGALKFAWNNPLLTTATAATLDLANGGHLSKFAFDRAVTVAPQIAQGAGNVISHAAERTFDSTVGDSWDQYAPGWLKGGLGSFMSFIKDNPTMSFWGIFALSLFMNGPIEKMLGLFMGNNVLTSIASMGLTALTASGIASAVTNRASQHGGPDQAQNPAPQTVPAPA